MLRGRSAFAASAILLACHIIPWPSAPQALPDAAAGCVDYELYLRWKGSGASSTKDLVLRDDRAYVIRYDRRFSIYDISDPGEPYLLASLNTAEGFLRGLDAEGDIACAVSALYDAPDNHGVLHVIDVSSPEAPQFSGEAIIAQGSAIDVAIQGDYAYCLFSAEDGTGKWGVCVFDISDPHSPSLASSVTLNGEAGRLALSGDHLHVAYDYLQSGHYALIDVADPLDPHLVGDLNLGESTLSQVVVRGNQACVGGSNFDVVDISDPANPVRTGSIEGLEAEALCVVGDHVIAGNAIIDISDPAMPLIVAHTYPPDIFDIHAVEADGSLVGYANDSEGLQLFDLSSPNEPQVIARVELENLARNIFWQNDRLYLPIHDYGLQILDVSDPGSPTLLGQIEVPGDMSHITVSGGLAYLSGWSSSMRIVDVRDPTQPALLGSVDMPYNVSGICVAGSHAYIPDGPGGLLIVDVSDPMDPFVAAELATWNVCTDVVVEGDLAYVSDASSLLIVDVSDPVNPEIIASESTGSRYDGIAKSGNFVYVEGTELQVIDVSNPLAPALVGSAVIAGEPQEIAVSGSTVYLDGPRSLQLVDVSDPTLPRYLGGVFVNGISHAMAVGDDAVFVIEGTWSSQFSLASLPTHCSLTAGPPQIDQNPTIALTAWPNPFNPHTKLNFSILQAGRVRLTIHNVTGRLIATLANSHYPAGDFEFVWRGVDRFGHEVPSGIYLARLDSAGTMADAKVTLLR